MKRTFLKVIVVALVLAGYKICVNVFAPIITNQVALSQLDDTSGSFMKLTLYNQLTGWIGLVLVVTCIVLFVPEIKKFINILKEKYK